MEKLIWTKENKERFWNYESQFEDRYYTFQVGNTMVRYLSKFFPRAKTVLDFGSGRGHLIKPLLEQGLEVSAFEYSGLALEEIKKKFALEENFNEVYDHHSFLHSQKKFDLIFLVEVFEHLDDKELDEVSVLVKNSLSKQGVAIITVPNNEQLEQSILCCPECRKTLHRWQHVRSWDKTSLGDYLQKKDFELLDVLTVNFNYEKEQERFNWRQKIAAFLTKKERKWVYEPHLVAVFRNK